MKPRHALLLLLALALATPASLEAAIAFRAAASRDQNGSAASITINVPAGTVKGDVMVALISVRPYTATIAAPAAFTPLTRVNQTTGTTSSLAVYTRVASSSEPASYTWTFSANTGNAGGILSFSGVDNGSPVDDWQTALVASGTSFPAPSVTTTVANTMIVTGHEFASSMRFTPPAGMTEAFDVASLAVNNVAGTAVEGSYVLQAAVGASGTKTATVTGNADTAATATLALRPVVCSAVSDTGYASATATSGQAIVYWAGASNVTVLRKTSAFGSERPADGVAYVVGDPVGAASVVYSGSAATFTQTGLTNGTAYHYKVFVRDGTPCYSTGTEVKASPVAGASPAWSYSMAGGSMLNPGITGYGTIYTSSNAGRIVSLSTADGTQSWTPVGTAAAVQGTLTWVPAAGFEYRRNVPVTAGTAAVPSGYSVPVTFDHASLVAAGKSLASGNDVRVYYWDGTAWTQLDRVLDEGASWNSATTTVWFQTQAAIGASGSDTGYYLFYGYPGAGAPPASASNVYLFYDDFAWSDAPANHGWTVRNSTWTADGSKVTAGGTAYDFAVMSHPVSTGDAIIEARALGLGSVCSDCRHIGVGLRFSDTGSGYIGIGYDYDTTLLTIIDQRAWFDSNQYALLGSVAQTLAADTWHRIKFRAIGTSLADKAWVDGAAEPGWQLSLTDATYASGTQIVLSGGWDVPKGSQWDWVKVRRAVDPEPTAAAAAEEGLGTTSLFGGDQSGWVYHVDGTTGFTLWSTQLSGADAVQAATAVQLRSFSDAAFQAAYTDDVIFVATRNASSTSNKVFAMRAGDGTVLWTFNGTGTYNVDYIVGMPYVDYQRNRLYVTSRAGAAGTQASLWVLDALTGALVQSFALGHIESSASLSGDYGTLYVGDQAGSLYALDTDAVALKWAAPYALGSALKGYVWEDWSVAGRIYFSTADGNVWCLQDTGTGASQEWKQPVAGASSPLVLDSLFVGSSDGTLHQLNLTSGVDEKQVTLGDGTATVGDVSTEDGTQLFVGTTAGTLYKLPLPLP